MGLDIVYLVKHDDENEELRHSLRSLINLPHDQVWLAGHCPPWVDAHHIPVPQYTSKHRSTTANLAAAIENPDVSDPFILFNDDFFVLHPLDRMPTYHAGSFVEWIRDCDYPSNHGSWSVFQRLYSLGYQDPLSYELHTPLVIDKEAMRYALSQCSDLPITYKRTFYGNLTKIGGELVSDCKIHDLKSTPGNEWQFVSTEDTSFECGRVGEIIRAAFPDKGKYECN